MKSQNTKCPVRPSEELEDAVAEIRKIVNHAQTLVTETRELLAQMKDRIEEDRPAKFKGENDGN